MISANRKLSQFTNLGVLMFSLRIAAVTLLSLLLWACSIDDQQPPSQVSITFYPPTDSFPLFTDKSTTISQKRFFRAKQLSSTESVEINQRADGKPPTLNGQSVGQHSTFLIEFTDSLDLELYSESGEFLYSTTLYSELSQKHLCLPSEPLTKFNMLVDLPVTTAHNKHQAHQFVAACRALNQ
jgi:hypothetical protein